VSPLLRSHSPSRCLNRPGMDDALGTLALATGVAGTILDATGVLAPVGLALNGASTALGVAQAGVDSASGAGNCTASATMAAVGVAPSGSAVRRQGRYVGADIASDTAVGSALGTGLYCESSSR
jgi:hypothetical protein